MVDLPKGASSASPRTTMFALWVTIMTCRCSLMARSERNSAKRRCCTVSTKFESPGLFIDIAPQSRLFSFGLVRCVVCLLVSSGVSPFHFRLLFDCASAVSNGSLQIAPMLVSGPRDFTDRNGSSSQFRTGCPTQKPLLLEDADLGHS